MISPSARALQRPGGCLAIWLVADDVLGGFFAINGSAFAGEAGNVFYYAPGSGEWEDCEMGYSQFVYWAPCGVRRNFTSRLYRRAGARMLRA